jgi:hypothetical protein
MRKEINNKELIAEKIGLYMYRRIMLCYVILYYNTYYIII